jgi:hypothetical protein
MCGTACPEAEQLASAIERGAKDSVLTAEAITPPTVVTQN